MFAGQLKNTSVKSSVLIFFSLSRVKTFSSLILTRTYIVIFELFLWLSFKTLHLLSFKILFKKPSADKFMSTIYYLNMYLEISQGRDVKGSLMLWSKHSVVIAGGVLPDCTQNCLFALVEPFLWSAWRQISTNDARSSSKGLFYGLFIFIVSYILVEIWEKRVGLDGITFGTEFCLWRHRRKIKEIKDNTYASVLSGCC